MTKKTEPCEHCNQKVRSFLIPSRKLCVTCVHDLLRQDVMQPFLVTLVDNFLEWTPKPPAPIRKRRKWSAARRADFDLRKGVREGMLAIRARVLAAEKTSDEWLATDAWEVGKLLDTPNNTFEGLPGPPDSLCWSWASPTGTLQDVLNQLLGFVRASADRIVLGYSCSPSAVARFFWFLREKKIQFSSELHDMERNFQGGEHLGL